VRTRPATRKEVEALVDRLCTWQHQQPGHLLGFRIHCQEDPDLVGFIAIWESEEAANKMAQLDMNMALASQIRQLSSEAGIPRFYTVEGDVPVLALLKQK
jgi:quinol monooxygenase YgiN